MRNYLIVYWFPLPNVIYVSLANNLIGIKKHRRFLMKGVQSSFCKRHSSRTIYHSNTEWVPYKIKLSHLRNVQIKIVNQSLSQQSDLSHNFPRVHHSHPVGKIMTLLCCSIFLFYEKLKHENPIISDKKNQWYESKHNNTICNIWHLTFGILWYSYQIKNNTVLDEVY